MTAQHELEIKRLNEELLIKNEREAALSQEVSNLKQELVDTKKVNVRVQG